MKQFKLLILIALLLPISILQSSETELMENSEEEIIENFESAQADPNFSAPAQNTVDQEEYTDPVESEAEL